MDIGKVYGGMKLKNRYMKFVAIIGISIFISMFLSAQDAIFINNVFEKGVYFNSVKEMLSLLDINILILSFVISFFVLLFLDRFNQKIWIYIYKYRYIIALTIFILCVIFEINGSSIGCFNGYLGGKTSDSVLMGTSRPIRTDEWATFTPMTFSQYSDIGGKFQYFSHSIRATQTDVFIIYGQPIYSFLMIFRPFQIGYLFLSPAKGLSFFWCGRLIALFMVTFEMGMLITKKKKKLSVVLASLITFAPVIQWWFAINGLVEMIIFGEIAMICVIKYMHTDNYLKRVFYAICISLCGVGYILTFYPAWMIPMAYVFLGIFIWIVATNYKEMKFTLRKDGLICLLLIITMIIPLSIVLIRSWDTIQATLNTVYPGSRSIYGGSENISWLGRYITNLLFPYTQVDIPENVCEMSVFYDFFPMGIVMALYVIFKEKKKDILLISLLVINSILTLFTIIEFPKILAKVLLLTMSTERRVTTAIGFINIILLIRALSLIKTKMNKLASISISVVLAVIVTILAKSSMKSYLNITSTIIVISVIMIMFIIILLSNKENINVVLIFTCIISIICGLLVNPIRKGTEDVFDNEIIKTIDSINKEDNGNWITEDLGLPYINAPLLSGVSVINCTNVYPNIKLWESLDVNNEYEEIYNRYAHIRIKLTDTNTKFNLDSPDAFTVNLNVDDISNLNVKYIISLNELEQLSNDRVVIEKIDDVDNFKFYKLRYI